MGNQIDENRYEFCNYQTLDAIKRTPDIFCVQDEMDGTLLHLVLLCNMSFLYKYRKLIK